MIDSLLNLNWIHLFEQYEQLYIGFSGGLDSTVLLHNLSLYPQLIHKITAIYINHNLNINSHLWQQHCEHICEAWKIKYCNKDIFLSNQSNIEENAREARYQEFLNFLQQNNTCLLTAHHRDDQMETVLLNLLRGTGIMGLCGMPITKKFGAGKLHRPLLEVTRQHLLEYAQSHNLHWINDDSNSDIKFSRNFIRLKIIPLLLTKWPNIQQQIIRTSQHCQQAQNNLYDLAKLDYHQVLIAKKILSINKLQTINYDRIANILRFWLKKNQILMPSSLILQRIINELILTKSDRAMQISWQHIMIKSYQDNLYLITNDAKATYKTLHWSEFPKKLLIKKLGMLTAESTVDDGIQINLSDQLEIRFRQGGEQFVWHGQTKSLKKLLQTWHIPPWKRDQIPLLYINNYLACVINYAISDLFYGSEKCYKIIYNPY